MGAKTGKGAQELLHKFMIKKGGDNSTISYMPEINDKGEFIKT